MIFIQNRWLIYMLTLRSVAPRASAVRTTMIASGPFASAQGITVGCVG